MENKKLYIDYCDSHPEVPLYLRPWWLDLVSENWKGYVCLNAERVIAIMPICSRVDDIVLMPPFTQFLGIWFDSDYFDKGTQSSVLGRKQDVVNDFINDLSIVKLYIQNFSSSFTDWLPFYWRGYSQTTRYSYVLDNLSDKQNIINNINSNIKRKIVKAQTSDNLRQSDDGKVEDILPFAENIFSRENLPKRFLKVFENLVEMAISRGEGKVWILKDNDEIVAANFIAYDDNTAYNIFGSVKDGRIIEGSYQTYMILMSIPEKYKYFDFEGSMLKGVEFFYRSFGGKQVQIFNISKGKLSIFKRIKNRFL